VPELQKLLTFQRGSEGVRAVLPLNDLGRDQLAREFRVEPVSAAWKGSKAS
jgi:hypothetical protein